MSRLKKQFVLIGVLVALAAVLLGVYFLVTSPEEVPEEVEERDEWGVLMKNGRHFVHDPVEVSDLVSVFVHNESGEYILKQNSRGEWEFDGSEGYELNPESLATLRTNARYLLSMELVETADVTKPEDYGITGDLFFEVTHHVDETYRVLVGDKTLDEKGYYVSLEGRDAIYIMDTGLENSVLLPVEAYVMPVIANTIDATEQVALERLSIFRGGDAFIRIDKVKDKLTYGNASTHRVTYPSYNYATNLTNFPTFLKALGEVTCTETVMFGDALTPEALSELGFRENGDEHTCDYTLTARFPSQEIILHFIKEESTYLIYSENKNIVVRASQESFPYLEWELISWVSSEVFLLDIFDVATMEFKSGTAEAVFELSGDEDLVVKCNDKTISSLDFKAVYQSFLYLLVTDWGSPPETTSEIMSLKITLDSGEVLDYSFTSASAVNSFYTLNGFGQFYVSREKLMEIKGLFEGLIP